MVHAENPDSCAICGNDVPDDPPSVTLPAPATPRLTPLASPGIRRIIFCSERHRRDWCDANRGGWDAEVDDRTSEDRN